ncbi:bifunctional 2-polyprenyl-6-hydroxyphenol methylase/3-demethylubiquinol 3-O-methyltransferase UbiG [Alsobacter sp. SYSU M60028]|uniref:Ubiquinone biosynthesis O-methyltransferase n=1 Tax=Alsobacter ponti TaxID=2962936 RepID=A0ABT1LDH9_9HYPH|nr:bifunctional 2-polyprenyl-6-hydroxyphenol methylase/3-demethylubiquinol 3-O-methyltransferase UbiG [Alsobacter ponti]MCP8938948.1 bifunctional 2-polyprenyl-6-hydroxyphenol methylase/3-demethylubiquinol 3-O-methyltransferase UbiG [Alsobacter ponti]
MDASPARGSVDAGEVERFDRLARTWWDPSGPMKPLHRLNPVRLAFIRDRVAERLGRDPRSGQPLAGVSVLDVGCGGGLLCEPLARLGADVTGIDPAPTNVEVARLHAERSGVAVTYRQSTVEKIVAEGSRFDVVLAMEVVEHVTDVDAFVAACCAAAKPDGQLFMATLNRTLRAFALAIVGAEYVLGWLPRGTHQWDKFVTPDELAEAIARGGLRVRDETGVAFNPLEGTWRLSSDTGVNYMVCASA